MAEAVIAIRALDLTRQAFLSVQQSLAKLQGAIGKAGVAIGGFLGLQSAKKALTAFNNALRDVEKESEKFGATKEELDKVTRATGAMDSVMQSLKMGVANAVNAVLDLKDSLTGVTKIESTELAEKFRVERDTEKIKELDEELGKLTRELQAVGETPAQHFARLAYEIERVNDAASNPALAEETNTLMRAVDMTAIEIEQRKLAVKINEEYSKSRDAVLKSYDEEVNKMLTADELYGRITKKLAALAAEEKQLISLGVPEILDPETITAEELLRMERLTKVNEEMNELIKERGKIETTAAKISRQAGEIISQSFEDAIFAGEKLSEVLRNLAQDLLRMAFREAVTAPLGTGLGSFFKNLFRAEGGPVGAGNPYIVGERGPELFVPRSSGSIVSNDNLSGATMGGGGINITYNIASGVSRAELGPLLESERRRLKAEIPDMVRRGGAYRAAFA